MGERERYYGQCYASNVPESSAEMQNKYEAHAAIRFGRADARAAATLYCCTIINVLSHSAVEFAKNGVHKLSSIPRDTKPIARL